MGGGYPEGAGVDRRIRIDGADVARPPQAFLRADAWRAFPDGAVVCRSADPALLGDTDTLTTLFGRR